jgi:hypothetical protein
MVWKYYSFINRNKIALLLETRNKKQETRTMSQETRLD